MLPRGLAVPLAALRGVTGNPALVRLQLCWALAVTAVWTSTVSLTAVAYSRGGSAAVGIAVLAGKLPCAAVGPVVGRVVDRVPKPRLLAGAALACTCGVGSAALVTQRHGPLTAVVVLVAVVQLAHMLVRAGTSAVLPELVDDPAQLTASNVLSSAVEAGGVFLGPALAGLLLAVHGPGLSFGVTSVLFAGAALAGIGLPRRPRRPSSSARTGGRGGVLRLPSMRLIVLLVVAQAVVSGALVVLYPSLAVDGLHADLGLVGALTAAYGLGGLVGSFGLFAIAGSSRLGRLTTTSLLLYGLPLALLPLLPHVAPVVALLLVVGVGNVLFDVTSVTLTQRAVPADQLGRAFGAYETAVVLGLGSGAVLAAALDGPLGPAGAATVLGGPLALVALLTAGPLAGLDRRLAVPAEQVALLRGLAPFALLSPAVLERLALALVRQEQPAGTLLAEQGAPGSDYLAIGSGSVDVAVDGVHVARLDAGDGFGEVALLRDGQRTATVTAHTPVVLWSLAGDVFLQALGSGAGLEPADALVAARLARAAPRGR